MSVVCREPQSYHKADNYLASKLINSAQLSLALTETTAWVMDFRSETRRSALCIRDDERISLKLACRLPTEKLGGKDGPNKSSILYYRRKYLTLNSFLVSRNCNLLFLERFNLISCIEKYFLTKKLETLFCSNLLK